MHVGLVKAFKTRQYLKEFGRKEYHPVPMFFLSVVKDKPLCKHRLQGELFEYTLCFKHEYTWVIYGDYVVLRP